MSFTDYYFDYYSGSMNGGTIINDRELYGMKMTLTEDITLFAPISLMIMSSIALMFILVPMINYPLQVIDGFVNKEIENKKQKMKKKNNKRKRNDDETCTIEPHNRFYIVMDFYIEDTTQLRELVKALMTRFSCNTMFYNDKRCVMYYSYKQGNKMHIYKGDTRTIIKSLNKFFARYTKDTDIKFSVDTYIESYDRTSNNINKILKKYVDTDFTCVKNRKTHIHEYSIYDVLLYDDHILDLFMR